MKGFDVEKSDLKMENEQADWGKGINKSSSSQNSKYPSLSILKKDNLGEINLWKVWSVSTKRTQWQKEK